MSFGIPVRNGVMLGLTASTALSTRGGFPVPALSLNFLSGTLDSRITFTRALDTATRVNSSGFIETVNANIPRFDYDPVTLQPRGLLVEESRANAFTYSQDFGNAAWTPTILDVSADAAASPDGTANADKLIPTTDSGVHGTKQPAALTNGVAYTMSGFFKADGYRRVMMRESTAFGYAAVFDLISGTVVATTDATGTITNFGNGWYRCEMRFTSGWTNTSDMYIFVLPDNGTGYGSATFAGDGTSGILAYGAQFEAGAFATSYIPTTTTSLTRNADVATMTGANFSSWYNATQGSFAAEFRPTIVGGPTVYAATDGTINNRVQGPASDVAQFLVSSGGAVQALLDGGTISPATVSKIASAYAVNDFALTLNAGTVATDATGTLPVVDRFSIASLIGNQEWLNGHIRAITYFNTRLPNDRLQALTR